MASAHGIDLSSYQHVKGINWDALGKSRYRVLIAKLTEGTGHQQYSIALQHGQEARRRGWDFTVYHFMDRDIRFKAKDEARWFLNNFHFIKHLCTLPPALDVEPAGTGNAWGGKQTTLTRTGLGAWCKEWSDAVGFAPMLYYSAGRSFVPAITAACPLSPRWAASRPWRVSANVDAPPDEPGWTKTPQGADVWQYASRCEGVPGIKGNCDRNLVRDVAALRRRWQ